MVLIKTAVFENNIIDLNVLFIYLSFYFLQKSLT